jgi:hypothetical protein
MIVISVRILNDASVNPVERCIDVVVLLLFYHLITVTMITIIPLHDAQHSSAGGLPGGVRGSDGTAAGTRPESPQRPTTFP